MKYFIVFLSAVMASLGQVYLKIGASNKSHWLEFINWHCFFGCVCYFIGLLLWIYSLSKLPLTIVYAFTMVTFVLVYVLNWLILNEPISKTTFLGMVVISIGFAIIYLGQTSHLKG